MAASARRSPIHPPDAKIPAGAQVGVSVSPRHATVHEAKTHLSRLLDEVAAGASVVITRRGKPVAKLEAIDPPVRRKRVPGSMKGLISIDDRFFEPLPDDVLKAWERD